MGAAIASAIEKQCRDLGLRVVEDAPAQPNAAQGANPLQPLADRSVGYLVEGGCSIADDRLVLDGVIVDVGSGLVLRDLHADGKPADFFALNDQIAAQLRDAIGNRGKPQTAQTPASPTPETPAYTVDPGVYDQGNPPTYSAPSAPYYEPSATYYDPYPYYSYPYPYSTVFVDRYTNPYYYPVRYPYHRFHDGDRRRDDDRRDYDRDHHDRHDRDDRDHGDVRRTAEIQRAEEIRRAEATAQRQAAEARTRQQIAPASSVRIQQQREAAARTADAQRIQSAARAAESVRARQAPSPAPRSITVTPRPAPEIRQAPAVRQSQFPQRASESFGAVQESRSSNSNRSSGGRSHR